MEPKQPDTTKAGADKSNATSSDGEPRRSYLLQLADKLQELDRKLQELKKKRMQAATGIKEDSEKISEELKTEKKIFIEDIQQVMTAANEGWHEVWEGFSRVVHELSEAIDKAISKFKQ